MQLHQVEGLQESLHEVNAKLDDLKVQNQKIIDSQNEIIDMANTLTSMAQNFSMPGPLAAMFGMGKQDGET